MSQLKVNTIRHTGASSDAVTLATDGTCTAKITNNLSNRNLIINGDFQVAQRGTSSTSDNYATVDRFALKTSGTDEGPTQAQHALTSSDTGPWEKGFRYSYHITNGNQTGGAGASDQISIRHRIESQVIGQSGWNYTSASSYITLSFWVKSSVAQTMYILIQSADGTWQNYPHPFSATTSWSKISFSIPGNSNIQVDNNTGEGLDIRFVPFYGTGLTDSGVADDTWAAGGANQMKDMTSTWYTTNDATFEITGVQLEVGTVATDFEHRSYGDELERCKRYFQFVPPTFGEAQHTTNIQGVLTASPAMRSSPTCAIVIASDNLNLAGSGAKTCTSVGTIYYNSTQGGWAEMVGSSFSQYRNYYILPNAFSFDAEL